MPRRPNPVPIYAPEFLQDGTLDAGLYLLSATAAPGREYSCIEIAQACGCTHANIRRLEQNALTKLRRALSDPFSVPSVVKI